MNKKICVSILLLCAFGIIPQTEAKLTKEAHSLYQQACQYEYKNDYANAIKVIQHALTLNGEDAMLYTKIAGLYADTGNYNESLSAYKKAIKLRPNDAFIYISMGNILQTVGDYENAYNSFKQAQTIYPEYKYNYLNLANIEYFRKNYPEAIEYYNKFLNAYPDHMEASENLANVYIITKEYDKACELYANIYKKYPSAFTDFEKYGVALFETKQYQAATTVLEKALTNNENSESVNARLALAYQNMGENYKALDYFKKTFALNPNLTALRFDYANLLGNMDKPDSAIEQYKEYLKAYPDDPNAFKNLGLVYKKTGNLDLALFNLEKAYSMDSSNQETKRELALCYHMKKDYVNALKFYDLALKSDPENIELLANKALTLHAMNNYVSAIELYRDILSKQSNDRITQNLTAASIAYGYSLYDKKDYGQAILYFEDAIDLNDREASAYFGYAMANEKMGCTEIALENYQKAVSLAPGNLEYAKALNNFKETCKPHQEIETFNPVTTAEKKQQVSIITPVVTEKQKNTDYTNESLLQLGNEAYKKQQYNEAIDYYTKAIIYNPSDKNTLLKIANIYKLIGNNTKALSFYDKLLSIDNNNTEAYFNKGLVYANQKDYDNCIKCFQKVIALSPDYPYAYYSLGMAYEQKGMAEKALEYYYLYTGLESDETVLNVVEQRIKKLENKE